MKPVLPTIGAAALCVTCGTIASAVYFALVALLCRLISNDFAAGTYSTVTWGQAAQFGAALGLATGLVCSGLLTLTACWSVDVPAMRKKFALQFMLALLAGIVLAAIAGTYAYGNSLHGGAFIAGLAQRQGTDNHTVLANVIFTSTTIGVLSGVILCMFSRWIFPRTAAAHLRALVLPFSVTKYLVLGAILTGTIWGLFLPSSGLFQATYKFVFGSVMWGVATVYLCDFTMALAGRSSPYWQKFYAENKTDLFVCGLIGLALVVLMTLPSERYSWYNLDLALLGLPFFLYAIFAIHECATISVAGRKLPLSARVSLYILFASMFVITMLVLRHVQSRTMPEYEALWYQITIFCSGIAALIFARQIPYMLKQGKIEPSPVLLALFSSMKCSPGIYAEAARVSEHWNQQIKLEKAALRKKKAREKKRKPR